MYVCTVGVQRGRSFRTCEHLRNAESSESGALLFPSHNALFYGFDFMLVPRVLKEWKEFQRPAFLLLAVAINMADAVWNGCSFLP